jgi:hypothetical protein
MKIIYNDNGSICFQDNILRTKLYLQALFDNILKFSWNIEKPRIDEDDEI